MYGPRKPNNLLYAAYRGDEYITSGSIREVAEKLGVTIKTAQYYMTPTWKNRSNSDKRVVVYRFEDD